MSRCDRINNILFSGSDGHSGRGIVKALSNHVRVRGLDIRPSDQAAECVVGGVTDMEVCRRAVAGMDAVVICHMAPIPESYQPPFTGIDVNVRGAANLYEACREADIRRVVLISSASIFGDHSDFSAPPGQCGCGPGRDLYPVTKMMQETLAYHYFSKFGILTQAIRPSWIVYAGDMRTKRGIQQSYDPGLIDPGDLAEVIRLCLDRDPVESEGFTVGQVEYPGVQETMRRLNWTPVHTFHELRGKADDPIPNNAPHGAASLVSQSQ